MGTSRWEEEISFRLTAVGDRGRKNDKWVTATRKHDDHMQIEQKQERTGVGVTSVCAQLGREAREKERAST